MGGKKEGRLGTQKGGDFVSQEREEGGGNKCAKVSPRRPCALQGKRGGFLAPKQCPGGSSFSWGGGGWKEVVVKGLKVFCGRTQKKGGHKSVKGGVGEVFPEKECCMRGEL